MAKAAKPAAKKTAAKKPAAKKPAAKKPAKRSMALCAQLYSLRNHLKTPAEMAATFKRVAKIGYKNVQISGLGPIEPIRLRELLDKNGLTAVGHHTNYKALSENFDAVVDELHTLGLRYTAIAWIGPEFRGSAAAWKKTAKLFEAVGKKLAAEGIALQYHNHDMEFERFNTPAGGKVGLEILYENTDPKYLQAELDLAWVARGLQSPAEWILRMKGRMDQVHFKDTVIYNDKEGNKSIRFAEIGSGNLDWKANIAACRKIGVQDVIVEQDGDWINNDPFKAMTVSYQFLRKMGLK